MRRRKEEGEGERKDDEKDKGRMGRIILRKTCFSVSSFLSKLLKFAPKVKVFQVYHSQHSSGHHVLDFKNLKKLSKNTSLHVEPRCSQKSLKT